MRFVEVTSATASRNLLAVNWTARALDRVDALQAQGLSLRARVLLAAALSTTILYLALGCVLSRRFFKRFSSHAD